VGDGSTSRLYKELVKDQKIATNVGGAYYGTGRDYGKIVIYGVPSAGKNLTDLEAAIDKVLRDVVENGITDEELARAKRVYLADHIYQSDSQSALARRYGYGLVVGQTITDIEEWPKRISKVTLADITKAASQHLDIRNSVTGHLTTGVQASIAN